MVQLRLLQCSPCHAYRSDTGPCCCTAIAYRSDIDRTHTKLNHSDQQGVQIAKFIQSDVILPENAIYIYPYLTFPVFRLKRVYDIRQDISTLITKCSQSKKRDNIVWCRTYIQNYGVKCSSSLLMLAEMDLCVYLNESQSVLF